MDIYEIIFLFVIGFACIIGGYLGNFLIKKGKQSETPALILLGTSFILTILLWILLGFAVKLMYTYFLLFPSFGCIQIFKHLTFHQERSKLRLLLEVMISYVFMIIQIAVDITVDWPELLPPKIIVDNVVSFCWFAYIFGSLGFSAWLTSIKMQKSRVSPWIIKRTRLVAISSFIEMFVNISDFLYIFFMDIFPRTLRYPITAIIATSFIVTQTIVWTMPDWLKKRWMDDQNQNLRVSDENQSESELNDDEIMRLMMGGE